MADPAVRDAVAQTAGSAAQAGKACMTFVPNTDAAVELRKMGISMFSLVQSIPLCSQEHVKLLIA